MLPGKLRSAQRRITDGADLHKGAAGLGDFMTDAEKKALVASVAFWFHSYDFGEGVSAAGHKSLAQLRAEWDLMKLPELRGKSVLDVNTWDGWFALQAERAGAGRVLGLDWYMWSMDQQAHSRYHAEHKAAGTIPDPYHAMPYFRPAELPGKVGFDTARRISQSRVEEMVGDFATMDLSPLKNGFDVVFYLGTLYHMADPIGNLRRLYEVTAPGGLAVIETAAMEVPGLEDIPMCENYGPLHRLNADSSNWWSPNAAALRQMLLAVGFEAAEVTTQPARERVFMSRRDAARRLLPARLRKLISSTPARPPVRRYRAFAHARRSSEPTTHPSPIPSA